MSSLQELYQDISIYWNKEKQRPQQNPSDSLSVQDSTVAVRQEGEYSHILEKFVPKGKKTASAKMRWIVNRARGLNPKKRVYYVTSGAHGEHKEAAKFLIRVQNKNDVYNFQNTFGAVALRTKGEGNPDRVVKLIDQTGNYKYFESEEIIDETSRVIEIGISVDSLREAYQMINLNDPLMQLDFQFYWQEIGITKSYHYNQIFCNFYLVNQIEFLFNERAWEVKDDVKDYENIKFRTIVKDGKEVKVRYPESYNRMEKFLFSIGKGFKYTFKVSNSKSESDSNTNQISTSVTSSKTDTNSVTVGTKLNIKESFGIDAKFISAGAEVGAEISQSFQKTTSQTKTIAKSYVNSRTVQAALRNANELTVSTETKDGKTSLMLKPIFKPVQATLVRFTQIDKNGVALKRTKDDKPMVIWVFERWALYSKVPS